METVASIRILRADDGENLHIFELFVEYAARHRPNLQFCSGFHFSRLKIGIAEEQRFAGRTYRNQVSRFGVNRVI